MKCGNIVYQIAKNVSIDHNIIDMQFKTYTQHYKYYIYRKKEILPVHHINFMKCMLKQLNIYFMNDT